MLDLSDFERPSSHVDLDPVLWFNMVKDGADLTYAIQQMEQDYGDLHRSIGEGGACAPRRCAEPAIKQQVLDIFYDAELLRRRSRKLLASAPAAEQGQRFHRRAAASPYRSRDCDTSGMADQARPFLATIKAAQHSCYDLLAAPS